MFHVKHNGEAKTSIVSRETCATPKAQKSLPIPGVAVTRSLPRGRAVKMKQKPLATGYHPTPLPAAALLQ